jgi:zinc and cadmium transporter
VPRPAPFFGFEAAQLRGFFARRWFAHGGADDDGVADGVPPDGPGGVAMTMTLLYIVIATFVGGLLSVVIAASLTVGLLSKVVHHLVSLSTGVLLGTALLQVLPEAFESSARPHHLFITLLGGLLFFFLLEKAELYRHGHHHESDSHHHHHGFDRQQAGRGGWSVLLGDSIHNFCDGIIIAAAFLADTQIGIVTATAIIAHEIPQEVGDYIVLLNAGFSRGRALFYNALSGMAAVLGGVVGYVVVGPWESLFPYLLVVASSSFIYVAVADLIPQLQHRLPLKDTLAQIGWLAVGIGMTVLIVNTLHAH